MNPSGCTTNVVSSSYGLALIPYWPPSVWVNLNGDPLHPGNLIAIVSIFIHGFTLLTCLLTMPDGEGE